MIQFQFGKTAFGSHGFFRIHQVGFVCGIDLVVQLETVIGTLHIGIGDTHLCDHTQRLGEVACFFRFDLRIICLCAHDVLRQFQNVVRGTDTDFHPVCMIQERVGGVGEIQIHTHVRHHHNDRLVKFKNIDMTLHVDFVEFRTVEQCDLFHHLQFRQIEDRRHFHIEHGGIHHDVGTCGKSHEGKEFRTAVFITARVVGEAFFHIHETACFVECTEGGDQTLFRHFRDQSVAGLAFLKQIIGNGDRFLCGGDLKINADDFHLEVLCHASLTLFADEGAVIPLESIDSRQTEVHHAQCQVDIHIVGEAVGRSGETFSGIIIIFRLDRFTAGCRMIVAVGGIVGNRQLRQHTECFRDRHIRSHIFFQFGNFDIQIVLQSQVDTFIQFEHMLGIVHTPSGAFKVDCHTFLAVSLVTFLRFTAGNDCRTRKSCEHQTFCQFHTFFLVPKVTILFVILTPVNIIGNH